MLRLLGLLQVAHDLLEERERREETDDLLLVPLDAVLLRRDCVRRVTSACAWRVASADEAEVRVRIGSDGLRSKRSLARLYRSRSWRGGPLDDEVVLSMPERLSAGEGRLPFLVKMVSRKTRLER